MKYHTGRSFSGKNREVNIMPQIDYIKVLDIAALTLETSSHIEVRALDLTIFNAVLIRDDGSELNILVKTSDYELELTLDNIFANNKEFEKWLSKFEYQLEQNFFKNISLEHHGSGKEYKIKILF
jgi:hypothetical protein